MSNDSNTLRNLASLLGSSGVALGAFGAHALKGLFLHSWTRYLIKFNCHFHVVLRMCSLLIQRDYKANQEPQRTGERQ